MPCIYKNVLLSFRKHVLSFTLISLALPTIAAAQNADTVTLTFAGGQDDVVGTLKDFKDGKFFVESAIGLIAIPANAAFCEGAACPDSTRPPVPDQKVVLTSTDGNITIAGDLIAVENSEYVLETAVGEQRIAASLVNCAGVGCIPQEDIVEIDRTVELVSGQITLVGELLGFEDNAYLIDEPIMGQIRANASQFECFGEACP